MSELVLKIWAYFGISLVLQSLWKSFRISGAFPFEVNFAWVDNSFISFILSSAILALRWRFCWACSDLGPKLESEETDAFSEI